MVDCSIGRPSNEHLFQLSFSDAHDRAETHLSILEPELGRVAFRRDEDRFRLKVSLTLTSKVKIKEKSFFADTCVNALERGELGREIRSNASV